MTWPGARLFIRIHPNSRKASGKTAVTIVSSSSEPALRKPVYIFTACCARAASGHTAAPPTVAKNFRRSM